MLQFYPLVQPMNMWEDSELKDADIVVASQTATEIDLLQERRRAYVYEEGNLGMRDVIGHRCRVKIGKGSS
jgi:hypothetical protein